LASSPIGAISVLAGIVVIHEAGHYLAARSFNISVDEFSVGFGPKLAGFSALGNEFNLRALPLGGFVRFPENYDIEGAEEKSRAAQEAFEKRRQEEGWTIKEDVLNAVTFGKWDERKRNERKATETDQAAFELKQRPWWKKLGGGKMKKSQGEDPEDFEILYYDDPNLLQNRPWTQRAVVLSGGVIFNLILAYLIYFGQIGPLGNGLPQPVFDNGVMVSQAPTRNGPSDGMLNKGDVIIGINGKAVQILSDCNGRHMKPLFSSSFLFRTLGNVVSMSKKTGAVAAQKQVSNIISTIRDTEDGESVTLSIIREGKNNAETLSITPKRNGQANPQAIGVFLSPNYLKTEKLQSDNILEAGKLAYMYLSNIFSQTLDGFLSFFSTLLSGKGTAPGQSLSGPVGLIKSGTQIVSTQDLTTVLLFAAALSVNLGVVNALPLPALDGGQLLFVLAEAVTGRKIDQRLQEGLTSVTVLFLFLVTLSTTFSDVSGIITGR
jgi:membrane-associated protease RseP (regulator of RpoE activity)